ncbi:MAG: bifunctional riboflavin kinase/FAD synthetase [Chloroflexi bacterium]|nr:bifunctional riboflavin kinase/FAD synthetase [Chloroflexota bacterium]
MAEQAAPTRRDEPVIVVLGAFDGVHRGHQALLRGAVAAAAAQGARVVAVTFDPDPEHVLRPAEAPPDLTTIAERVQLIRQQGVDEVCVWPFTPAVAQMQPEAFVAALCARYSVVGIWVGENFRFGHGRTGSPATLATLGQQLGFTVHTLPPVFAGDRPISSSWIRELLLGGAVRAAAELLGRPYRLEGEVVGGARRGRQLGFPTANLVPPAGRLVPAPGVYAGWARVPTGAWPAVANLGSRPTFGEEQPLLEVHLLDYAGDLYGQSLAFDFLDRVRPVQRFASVEALRAQIARDIDAARALLHTPAPPAGAER